MIFETIHLQQSRCLLFRKEWWKCWRPKVSRNKSINQLGIGILESSRKKKRKFNENLSLVSGFEHTHTHTHKLLFYFIASAIKVWTVIVIVVVLRNQRMTQLKITKHYMEFSHHFTMAKTETLSQVCVLTEFILPANQSKMTTMK